MLRDELDRVERLGAIGTWHWDLARDELRISDGARAILGLADEQRTYTFGEITSIVQLGEPERVDEVLARLRKGGPPVELRTALTTPAGERKELETRAEAVLDEQGNPRELRGFFQDVTERRRAEQEREAVHEVTRALAEAVTVDEAVERVLAALAESTDWQAATFWTIDEAAAELRCERVWMAAGDEDRLEEFAGLTHGMLLRRGEGVPGQAWAERSSVWREVSPDDDPRAFPRSAVADRGGLQAVLAFPLLGGGDEVIGVIDLWRRTPGEPPRALVELLGSFGRQIGQFVERTRAESELHEARVLTASVIDAALDCVITIDAHGHVLEWNPAAERTFGFAREEVLGRELAELIIPERYRALHREGLALAREAGEGRLLGRRIEIEAIRAGGEEFPVELTLSRVGVGPPRYAGWVRDITDRRRAEEDLRESRRLLAETQLLARIGSWEWHSATDAVRTTEQVRRLLGLDLSGGPVGLEGLLRAVDPAHREGLRQAIESSPADGRPLEYVRTPLAGGPGEARVVEWFAAPVARPKTEGVVQGTVQDVTPEARLEQELQARARMQKAVSDLGSKALHARDVDAVIEAAVATVTETLELEHCAVMELLEGGEGLLLRAGVGWRPGLVGSLVVRPGTASHAGAVIARGEPVVSDDLTVERAFEVPPELFNHGIVSAAGVVIGGDSGPIGSLGAYSRAPERFGADAVTFLQGIANVLAAAFAAERAAVLERGLQQAQRLDSVGKLAGGIAHDFNNLLGVILSSADLALEEILTGGGREEIEEIKSAAERAAALTRQLLLFSRKDVTPAGVVHAEEVLRGMEAILARAAGEHMTLSVRIEAGLPPVRIAESMLEQVLLNLALNAADAMPDGGEITIELAAARSDEVARVPQVRLSVIDHGTGMAREVLDRAFEPFYTTKPEGRGTGLGLATCYGIVQRAGGRIAIESEVGVGTRVEVLLLAADEEPRPAEAQARPSGGSETVLLVEDEEPLRRVTRRILEGAGYTVLDADGPRQAREVWQRLGTEVDVLLTDVVMPECSGVELWRELAAERPGLAAIYMSGYSADAVAPGAGDTPRHMLEKPFTSAELLETVRAALGGRTTR